MISTDNGAFDIVLIITSNHIGMMISTDNRAFGRIIKFIDVSDYKPRVESKINNYAITTVTWMNEYY